MRFTPQPKYLTFSSFFHITGARQTHLWRQFACGGCQIPGQFRAATQTIWTPLARIWILTSQKRRATQGASRCLFLRCATQKIAKRWEHHNMTQKGDFCTFTPISSFSVVFGRDFMHCGDETLVLMHSFSALNLFGLNPEHWCSEKTGFVSRSPGCSKSLFVYTTLTKLSALVWSPQLVQWHLIHLALRKMLRTNHVEKLHPWKTFSFFTQCSCCIFSEAWDPDANQEKKTPHPNTSNGFGVLHKSGFLQNGVSNSFRHLHHNFRWNRSLGLLCACYCSAHVLPPTPLRVGCACLLDLVQLTQNSRKPNSCDIMVLVGTMLQL